MTVYVICQHHSALAFKFKHLGIATKVASSDVVSRSRENFVKGNSRQVSNSQPVELLTNAKWSTQWPPNVSSSPWSCFRWQRRDRWWTCAWLKTGWKQYILSDFLFFYIKLEPAAVKNLKYYSRTRVTSDFVFGWPRIASSSLLFQNNLGITLISRPFQSSAMLIVRIHVILLIKNLQVNDDDTANQVNIIKCWAS